MIYECKICKRYWLTDDLTGFNQEELKEHFKYKHSYEYKKIYRSRLTTLINKSFNKYNDDGSKLEE